MVKEKGKKRKETGKCWEGKEERGIEGGKGRSGMKLMEVGSEAVLG